jgi:hypothetical protein
MIERFFLSHPRSVGESYGEHAATAARFGFTMIVGGAACVVHAIFPALFPRTASDRVKTLYAQMKARQPAFAQTRPAFQQPEWQIEYEI